nr:hypothetical protein Iba_chr07eCG5670 [Ipomoea batatas]
MFVERGAGKKAATSACCLEGGAGESHGEGDVAAATNHDYALSSSSVAITIEFGDGRGEPPSCSLFTAERGENTATSPSLLRRKSSPAIIQTLRKESHADAAIGTATIRHRSQEREKDFAGLRLPPGRRLPLLPAAWRAAPESHTEEGDVAAATNHDYALSSSSVAHHHRVRRRPRRTTELLAVFTAERGENTATSPSLLRRKLPSRRDPPLTLLRLPFESPSSGGRVPTIFAHPNKFVIPIGDRKRDVGDERYVPVGEIFADGFYVPAWRIVDEE